VKEKDQVGILTPTVQLGTRFEIDADMIIRHPLDLKPGLWRLWSYEAVVGMRRSLSQMNQCC